jgi:hypothetical protein
MQALSILQDALLEAPAQADTSLRHTRTEEEARADFDAVFEFACRLIIIKSLPGWIEELCTEHLQSAQRIFAHTTESGSIQPATGAHNADTSVWKKN